MANRTITFIEGGWLRFTRWDGRAAWYTEAEALSAPMSEDTAVKTQALILQAKAAPGTAIAY